MPHVADDSLLALAREITVLEDDIRRDGSITAKAPDVWGEGNLMAHIQEYDRLFADSVKTFNETLQAYVARSDQMELQSATALGTAVGEGTLAAPTATFADITTIAPFNLLETAKKGAAPTKTSIGVEPTELERQRSTFTLVNQALRRRNTGDDNSRAAGYALYKFRIPVSVLPGRETAKGHAALVTMRAQLQVDAAHLKYTFPKLVIADLVETPTAEMLKKESWAKAKQDSIKQREYGMWESASISAEPGMSLGMHEENWARVKPISTLQPQFPVAPEPPPAMEMAGPDTATAGPDIAMAGPGPDEPGKLLGLNEVYGEDSIDQLRSAAFDYFN